jgi:hypothetical protein
VLSGHLAKPSHEALDALLIFLCVCDSVVDVLWPYSRLLLAVLNRGKSTGRLKTISRSSQNLA